MTFVVTKKKMTKFICDRCKSERVQILLLDQNDRIISTEHEDPHEVVSSIAIGGPIAAAFNNDSHIDLCNACEESFNIWLKNPERKPDDV